MQLLNATVSTSLASLVQVLLGVNLDKHFQHDDYAQNPLSIQLIRYSALDALMARWCTEKIREELQKQNHNA